MAPRLLAAAGTRVRLILMDVQMPNMGGLEAAAAIRTLERGTGRHVPIVALTAHAMKGDRERCLEAGMDGYVSKPIQANHLLEVMAQVTSPAGETAERAHIRPCGRFRVHDMKGAGTQLLVVRVAVGMPVARHPPHGPVRALISAHGSYLGCLAQNRSKG